MKIIIYAIMCRKDRCIRHISITSRAFLLIIISSLWFALHGFSQEVRPVGSVGKGYELIWQDEFSSDGRPDNSKWTYDIGNGKDGWGNQELEYYTDRSENVIIKDGFLKITALKESYNGYNYTSTRMKTLGKFSFTHGILEIRAKLPGGVGTWPALWMLGEKVTTLGWPACGEIDMMEYAGKDMDLIHGSIHNNASFGNTVNTKTKIFKGVEEEFHVYSVEWTATEIRFMVDGDNFYTYKPAEYNQDTWPFNEPFFIIMNVAIGGGFAGRIVDDSIFPQTMTIDYVRVFQVKN